ncbi:MAG: hypothetical protein RJA70_3230, partial [Pseudomonadota bacterium]
MNNLNQFRALIALSTIAAFSSPHIALAESTSADSGGKTQVGTPTATAPDGVSFVLSGGMGAVGPAGPGGGLQGALTLEQMGFGLGLFAAAAGATGGGNPDPDAEELSDTTTALVWGYGALVTWQPVSTGLVPLFGAGLGYGTAKTSHTWPQALYENQGAIMNLHGGIGSADGSSLLMLRALVPLFSAQAEYGPGDKEYVMSVTAEYG